MKCDNCGSKLYRVSLRFSSYDGPYNFYYECPNKCEKKFKKSGESGTNKDRG